MVDASDRGRWFYGSKIVSGAGEPPPLPRGALVPRVFCWCRINAARRSEGPVITRVGTADRVSAVGQTSGGGKLSAETMVGIRVAGRAERNKDRNVRSANCRIYVERENRAETGETEWSRTKGELRDNTQRSGLRSRGMTREIAKFGRRIAFATLSQTRNLYRFVPRT